MGLFESLKDRCSPAWVDYTEHEFVEQLGRGTLPTAVFQAYLVQDFHFLVQFARATALAAFKSRTLADITAAHAATGAILAETELHLRLTERWGIPRAQLEAAPEKQATVAYTRYVLDCGMSGDLLDLHVALIPCVIGYGEIAKALAPNGPDALGDHPYREWIGEYAGEGYLAAAAGARANLDRLAARGVSEERFAELVKIFAMASRLEAGFWQMGLDLGAEAKVA